MGFTSQLFCVRNTPKFHIPYLSDNNSRIYRFGYRCSLRRCLERSHCEKEECCERKLVWNVLQRLAWKWKLTIATIGHKCRLEKENQIWFEDVAIRNKRL